MEGVPWALTACDQKTEGDGGSGGQRCHPSQSWLLVGMMSNSSLSSAAPGGLWQPPTQAIALFPPHSL